MAKAEKGKSPTLGLQSVLAVSAVSLFYGGIGEGSKQHALARQRSGWRRDAGSDRRCRNATGGQRRLAGRSAHSRCRCSAVNLQAKADEA